MTLMTTSRFRSQSHLNKVRGKPCLICASPETVAHHLMFTEHPALSLKVSDLNTAPLCSQHHRELHLHGNEEQWWALQGVDPMEFVKEVTKNG